ncbi:hypothetical protein Lal_00001671 [Lupinus albus]|nr:hypothetical protein Lal_00001671 [Lupinus albus]
MAPFVPLMMSLLIVSLILFYGSSSCNAKHALNCSRFCGVHNISHPFRLNDSPKHCGKMNYTLSCENNELKLYWKSKEYYYVQSINYNNYTIRVVDANIVHHYHHSFLPPSSLPPYSYPSFELYRSYQYLELSSYPYYGMKILTKVVTYMRCPYPVMHGTATCMKENGSYIGEGSVFRVNAGNDTLQDLRVGDSCRIEFMQPTSWPEEYYNQSNISCTDIHNMLLYGFELSWLQSFCAETDYFVQLDYDNNPHCDWIQIGLYIGAKFLLGTPFVIIFLIYKWRRRHLSMYEAIENYLQSDNNIMPIRYSYRDIKNITSKFKTKLGKGGFGSVFKGKLRSGRIVAVKVLDQTKGNGQDFINEVATIGRIHHVNVVQLIGFCVEGSKRALIYDFMPNGSLEKYIFSHEDESSLSCEILYSIALGIAHGIEYLHNGCNMKILHFDIKPHNILLDEKFNPKVSDFGLARLYPIDNSIVSLTGARGTIGYMAPLL